MPVTFVNDYCPNCRCASCVAMRYPETSEQIGRRVGRRVAAEIFDKVEAELNHKET